MKHSLLIAGLWLVFSRGLACDLAGSKTIELESGIILHYRYVPSPLHVAQHFSMQFRACQSDQPVALERLKVDALMPSHGHGMNYKTSVQVQPDGTVNASGLMFHMPGEWQIKIDLSYNGQDQRIRIDYLL